MRVCAYSELIFLLFFVSSLKSSTPPASSPRLFLVVSPQQPPNMNDPVEYGGTVYDDKDAQKESYPPPPQEGYTPESPYPPPATASPYPPQPQAGYPPQVQGGYPPQQPYPGQPQLAPYPPQQVGAPYPPQQGPYPPQQVPYPPQQVGVPYPPQQVVVGAPGPGGATQIHTPGTTVVVVSTPQELRLPVSNTTCLGGPKIERRYPIELQGFVREGEHFELVDEVNEFMEAQYGPMLKIKLFLILAFCLPAFLIPLSAFVFSWGDEDVLFEGYAIGMVVVFVLLFGFAIYGARKSRAILDDVSELVSDLSSSKFQSRGLQYRFENEIIEIHGHATTFGDGHHHHHDHHHHGVQHTRSRHTIQKMSLVISFAPGAQPTVPRE